MKDARGRWEFEILVEGEQLDYEVKEYDITNADPRTEFVEPEDQDTVNETADNDDLIILDRNLTVPILR